VYSNIFKSTFNSLDLQSGSIAQIAPVFNGSQWVWYGGYNLFTADAGSCIYFSSGSNPITSPNGKNCFYTLGQPHYKITGVWCSSKFPDYNSYDNYWSPSPPVFNIICNGNPVTVNYNPALSICPTREYGDFTISDAGNGVIDTLFTTSAGEGGSVSSSSKKSSSNDAVLFYQSVSMRKQGNFSGAILKNKELINNHDTSRYFYSALNELYMNSLESDTIDNQNITNGLFNELKSYLAQKMQQYQTDVQFVEMAYKYVLMCLVKTESYQEAIAGYENIINNHPDEIVRLNASWDRSAVVLLMGQGGSENQLKIAMRSRSNYKLRFKKLLDKNPAHKIAKEIFAETKENVETSDISDEFKYTKQEKAELDRRIENFNPYSTVELRDKINSDIKLVSLIQKNKTERTVKTTTPKRFTLHQNYPNPFNPTTNIKYEIPKDGFISLKVYDVLGREIFSVNEFKKAGSHETVFDGSGFASGVYFYSIETNGLKQTKKMLMVK
jgi:hypothetical protein